jgi:hypothetical protein
LVLLVVAVAVVLAFVWTFTTLRQHLKEHELNDRLRDDQPDDSSAWGPLAPLPTSPLESAAAPPSDCHALPGGAGSTAKVNVRDLA